MKLDVTDSDSIAAAKKQLDERGLSGLVNNAGVAVSGPMEYLPLDELRHQLEVNLVGQVAVIQAFMPNIREAKGRIVNVSSIGGKMALPLVGPYAASKFGLEAVSDSLRRELRPWGIHVSLIEPGAVVTPIWERGRETADRLEAEMGDQARARYGKLADKIRVGDREDPRPRRAAGRSGEGDRGGAHRLAPEAPLRGRRRREDAAPHQGPRPRQGHGRADRADPGLEVATSARCGS